MNTAASTINSRTGKLDELRQRIFFVIGALIVYRIGSHIPVPGVDPRALAAMFAQQGGSILDMEVLDKLTVTTASVEPLPVMPWHPNAC